MTLATIGGQGGPIAAAVRYAHLAVVMVNHWLNNFGQLVSDSKEVNTLTVLDARMQACLTERGRKPNFVAVNWVNLGALNQVVDRLNGF